MSKIVCNLNDITAGWTPGNVILSGVNLEIDAEKTPMIPLMGPTGRGKSTLLYLMSGLKLPLSGSVTWSFPGDRELHSWDKKSRESQKEITLLHRKSFGFVFQDNTVFQHLTVEENLVYPLFLKGEPWEEARDKAREAIDQILLPAERENKKQLLKQFPGQLSGGQRQRVALMQAMLHDPAVLFADEPTGHLDESSRKMVLEILYNWVMKEERGKKCLIWVTHFFKEDSAILNSLVPKKGDPFQVKEYLSFQYGQQPEIKTY